MGTWDEMARRDPDMVAAVGWLVDVAQAIRSERQDVGVRELRGREVLGIGVLAADDDARPNVWEPTLFVTGSSDWEELGYMPVRVALGQQPLGGEESVRVVSLPPAVPQAGTGDRCDTATAWGTLGARVTAKSGVPAVLVAGHVAGATRTSVTDEAGHALGTVAECVHPGQVGPQVATGDVAVVELDDGVVVGGVPHSTVTAAVLPRDDVEIHGAATGVTRTWIRGPSPFWAGPDPTIGDWAAVLITRDCTTADGDSGALVLRDGTLDPIGHVVGGAPGVYTLIQELDAQLAWVGGISLR